MTHRWPTAHRCPLRSGGCGWLPSATRVHTPTTLTNMVAEHVVQHNRHNTPSHSTPKQHHSVQCAQTTVFSSSPRHVVRTRSVEDIVKGVHQCCVKDNRMMAGSQTVSLTCGFDLFVRPAPPTSGLETTQDEVVPTSKVRMSTRMTFDDPLSMCQCSRVSPFTR